MEKVAFEPIGFVSTDMGDPKKLAFACEDGLHTHHFSKIVVDEKYIQGLKGIEEFSHLFVLYHLDRVKKVELVTHPGPPAITNLPKVGVFASRSQYRPNPIALRLVKLEKVDKNTLFVNGLDAANNSPVLDIKPYVPGFDRPQDYKIASWYDWMS